MEWRVCSASAAAVTGAPVLNRQRRGEGAGTESGGTSEGAPRRWRMDDLANCGRRSGCLGHPRVRPRVTLVARTFNQRIGEPHRRRGEGAWLLDPARQGQASARRAHMRRASGHSGWVSGTGIIPTGRVEDFGADALAPQVHDDRFPQVGIIQGEPVLQKLLEMAGIQRIPELEMPPYLFTTDRMAQRHHRTSGPPGSGPATSSREAPVARVAPRRP